jgi:hypothetical protein
VKKGRAQGAAKSREETPKKGREAAQERCQRTNDRRAVPLQRLAVDRISFLTAPKMAVGRVASRHPDRLCNLASEAESTMGDETVVSVASRSEDDPALGRNKRSGLSASHLESGGTGLCGCTGGD